MYPTIGFRNQTFLPTLPISFPTGSWDLSVWDRQDASTYPNVRNMVWEVPQNWRWQFAVCRLQEVWSISQENANLASLSWSRPPSKAAWAGHGLRALLWFTFVCNLCCQPHTTITHGNRFMEAMREWEKGFVSGLTTFMRKLLVGITLYTMSRLRHSRYVLWVLSTVDDIFLLTRRKRLSKWGMCAKLTWRSIKYALQVDLVICSVTAHWPYGRCKT